jgi:hypothetical protein
VDHQFHSNPSAANRHNTHTHTHTHTCSIPVHNKLNAGSASCWFYYTAKLHDSWQHNLALLDQTFSASQTKRNINASVYQTAWCQNPKHWKATQNQHSHLVQQDLQGQTTSTPLHQHPSQRTQPTQPTNNTSSIPIPDHTGTEISTLQEAEPNQTLHTLHWKSNNISNF